MPVIEHAVQPLPEYPAEQHVSERAARQLIIDAIGEACLAAAGVLKFVPVDPSGEGSLGLFVDEQPVPLIRRMQCGPREDSNTKFHARTGLNRARPADYSHLWECRRK